MPKGFDAVSIVGTPDTKGWSQIYTFRSSLDTNSLFSVVISLEIKENETYIDKLTAGQQFAKTIHEAYGELTASEPLLRLKQSIHKAQKVYHSDEVHVAVINMEGEKFYCSAKGNTAVWLVRDGKMGKLVGESTNISGIVGKVYENDTLFIGTSSFYSAVPKGVLSAAAAHRDTDTLLAPIISSQEVTGLIAAMIIKIGSVLPLKEGFAVTQPPAASPETDIHFSPNKPERASFLERMLEKFPAPYVRLKPDHTQELKLNKRKKLSAIIGITLLALLFVSIWFGTNKKHQIDIERTFQAKVQTWQQKLSEAETVAAFDKQRARDLFIEVRDEVSAIELTEDNQLDLENFKRQLYEKEGLLLGQYQDDAEIFVDLSLLSEGFRGKSMTLLGGAVYILDQDGNRIAKTTLENKRSEIIAGPSSIKNAKDLTGLTGEIYVLTDSEIVKIERTAEEIGENTVDAGFIQSYLANLYLLSTQNSRIFKIPFSENGLGVATAWLKDDVTPDLTRTVDFAIDGFVWVLSDDGSLLKFASGQEDSFTLKNNPNPLQSATALYTDSESDYLYILSRNDKRIVVTDKNGEFVAEYMNEELGNGRALVVSEGERVILILTDTKVVSIPLRH